MSIPTRPSTVLDDRLAAADGKLLGAAAAGDSDSFEELYRRHAPMIRGRIRRRCGDPELAEEVVQDTFLAVWRGAHRWDGRGEVRAWIWGIAVRRLADALRMRLSRRDPPLSPEGVMPSAEEELLRELQYGDLGKAMSLLSPDLQLVVHATIVHQLTTREAASALGIPAGTVKTRMMRARVKLRQVLAC